MNPLPWLFALAGLVSLDARIINPVLPAIAASLAATPGEVGYAATAYALAYGVLQLVWGPLSDRYGRVRTIRLTALAFAAVSALGGLAGSIGGFVGARLLTGACAAATIPTTFAYIGDTVRYETRHRAVARFSTAMAVAQALSFALAGAVTYVVSWRVMFVGYAVLAVFVALPLFRVREAPRAAAAAEPVGYLTILARPRARPVYLAAFAEGGFVMGGTTYLGVLASQRLGFNDLQVGLLLAAYGIGMIVGGLTASRLRGHLGERPVAATGGMLQGLAWGLLLPALAWPVFAAALLALGVGWSWLHIMLQTRATEILPEARAKAFSLFPLSFSLGGAVGTALIGRLVDAGLMPVAIVACGVGLVLVGQYAARRR